MDTKSKVKAKETTVSKASVAREFMKKIGAFSTKPPEGWADKVEDHLKEKGFSIPASSKVQIYTIRSEAMKKEAKANRSANSSKSQPKRKTSGTVHKVTLEDLAVAKKHAAANGGITKCLEALKALQNLSFE
jgi:hypothetical protein